MSDAWTELEVAAAVESYLEMLALELSEIPFNKAEYNRNLQQLLLNRTKGSIERKHQNISAVLIELGYPYIDGYKPLGNYQELLRQILGQRLSGATKLNEAAQKAVESPIIIPKISDIMSILVPPPKREKDDSAFREVANSPRIGIKRNYLEIEARNSSLGRAGEEFVLRFEQERLYRAGKKALADRVEHVSNTQGDGLGYDILSFQQDGREKLIEVKTTRFGSLTPFFTTRNEVEVSDSRKQAFHLYRLFKFAQQPRLFILEGSLRTSCELEPIHFSGVPK